VASACPYPIVPSLVEPFRPAVDTARATYLSRFGIVFLGPASHGELPGSADVVEERLSNLPEIHSTRTASEHTAPPPLETLLPRMRYMHAL